MICNPSNPLGTIINKDELEKIANVIRRYPELHLIFDEAYAEMTFIEMPSFLKVAPDLKERTIILRSATKALSAAGERMAVILAFDDYLVNALVNQKITSYIHAPISAQIAYAETMLNFGAEDRKNMSDHYEGKVKYVMQRIKDMGAEMPCSNYQVEATFYALGDFSDLLGVEMPSDSKKALGEVGLAKTGEDLAYYLLFKDNLMVAPLSYFGLNRECGYLRITCSEKQNILKELMDRLEKRLLEARNKTKNLLIHKYNELLSKLNAAHHNELDRITTNVIDIMQSSGNCKQVKIQIESLKNYLSEAIKICSNSCYISHEMNEFSEAS